MTVTWIKLREHIQVYIALPELVVVENRKVPKFHVTAAPSSGGAIFIIEYSAVGSLSTASTRRQLKAKQPLGVVATGLSAWARSRRAPQSEKSRRVGNLKLMPLTNPTP